VASADSTSVAKGNPVTFDAGGSSDPDDPPPAGALSYRWDFGDGSPAENGVSVTHVFANVGTYPVTLTVTDDNNAASTATVVVTVSNNPPTAVITSASPNPVDEGSSITFDGSGSSDPDSGDVLTYQWDFGDGTPPAVTTNTTTSHTYADGPATYNVTLMVTDGDGGSDTATMSVDVNNVAPTAAAAADRTNVNVGDTVNFDGSGSTDPGNDSLTYTWNFGDGTPPVTTANTSTSHTYASGPATYNVTLTVTDSDGATSSPVTLQVAVNAPPIANASASPNPVDEGSSITFDGSGSSDPGGGSLSYNWDFGDGNSASGPTVSHVYPDGPANYNVTLTVTDSDGATATATISVDVSNVAPTAQINASANNVNIGDTVNFDGSGTDPGNDSLSYTWDFGDGASDSGTTVSHSWTSSGTYTIILTVSDDEGGVGTAQVQVTVN
jgi:PKD repeat protein